RLVSGEVDLVVAGAPITEELEARVNLSDPYVRVRQALLVNVSVRPDLAAAEELTEGDDVAVIQGSTGQAWAATHLEPGAIEVVPYDDAEEAAVALAAGSVDALLADEVSAIAGIASRESLRIVETFPTGEGLGVAVDPRNPRLLGAVNAALMAVAADGTYDLLYDRYRDTLPPGGRITRA
ncbi:MAG: transporter substrate-binding domain-containing protein, partial [Actinomycetota bacterium]